MDQNIGNQVNTQVVTIKDKLKKLLNWKFIFLVAGIALLAEGVWAVKFLTKPGPKPILAPKQVVPMASLELKAAKGDFKVGDKFIVDIILSTGGKQTDGADAILLFDPKVLEVDVASGSAKGAPVREGKIYKEYPANSLDPSGKIFLSGISSGDKGFSGVGVLGSVMFKAKTAGQTSLKFDYKSGSTTDSNVIESKTARDILIFTKGVTLNIK